MVSQKIQSTFQLIFKIFFLTYSLSPQSQLHKFLENGFYGLLIFPISIINLTILLPVLINFPETSVLSIGNILITMARAINFIIFGKLKKPLLKKFFIQTDKLINEIEFYTKTDIDITLYRRKSNLRLAATVASILYLYLKSVASMDQENLFEQISYAVFDVSTSYYSLWIFGTGLSINCTCIEIYVKLIFVLKQANYKYCGSFYLSYNQVFRNMELFYTIFDTTTVILVSSTFLSTVLGVLVMFKFKIIVYELILRLFLTVLVGIFLLEAGRYLDQGVSF